jgi:hypothetical protein
MRAAINSKTRRRKLTFFRWPLAACGAWLVLSAFTAPASAQDCDDGTSDLLDFLVGTYGLIGQLPGNGETYAATVRLERDGCRLRLTRCEAGEIYGGQAELMGITADQVPILRFQYARGGQAVTGRYLIRGDLNNYAAMTGKYIVGGDGQWPGHEYLYIDETGARSCGD